MPHNSRPMYPMIVIVGETGSGKSALALDLARRFDGEIISADSWQVYKDFDIGTSKPTAAEQELVPHHLIDIADAAEGFNAALYQRLAFKAIGNIQARGKLPIMVGGTGLYIDSVLYEFGFLPAVNPALRAQRNQQTIDELLAKAQASGLDMSGIDIRNKRRIIRALEAGGRRPTSKVMRSNTLVLGILTPRDVLKARVTQRVKKMLEQGLQQEVAALADRHGWEAEPMKGIGYREWQLYFTGTQNIQETEAKIIKSTMDLAKRQRTWFKRNKSIHWLDDPSNATKLVSNFLNKIQ